jgi:anti-anti-sigma factor
MSTPQPQVSTRLQLALVREPGKAPGTVVFRCTGPFTARTVFAHQSPDTVNSIFDLHSMLPSGEIPALNIFDLTAVPYMDSAGLGMLIRHYVRCQDKGVRFLAAGVSPRVLELFKLTKVDAVLPMVATVAEADIS